MKLEIVCVSLSEWQGLSVISFSSSNLSLLPHNAIKQFHIYLYGTIVI